jgi:hypothetical protein
MISTCSSANAAVRFSRASAIDGDLLVTVVGGTGGSIDNGGPAQTKGADVSQRWDKACSTLLAIQDEHREQMEKKKSEPSRILLG